MTPPPTRFTHVEGQFSREVESLTYRHYRFKLCSPSRISASKEFMPMANKKTSKPPRAASATKSQEARIPMP